MTYQPTEVEWTPTHTTDYTNIPVIVVRRREFDALVEGEDGSRWWQSSDYLSPIPGTYTVTVELSENDYRADGGLTITCIDKLASAARAARDPR